MPTSYPVPTQMVQQVWGKFVNWLMRSYPLKDYPLNIRPGIIFATAIWIIILGILGMAPLPELPLNDKALHFFGLGFATFLLYFIIEVPEGVGRRIWYIRRAPLLFTLFTAFFIGGIISEFIQSLLPANLLGSILFLYLANLINKRNILKLELLNLYQPLNNENVSSYRDSQGRIHQFNLNSDNNNQIESTTSSNQNQNQNQNQELNSSINNRNRQVSEIWDDEDSDFSRSSQDTARGYNDNSSIRIEGSNNIFELGDEESDHK
uniref:Uncharacterized protein n=1 Tax=Kwoniella pini CBS 10737 TaxID=1296096 RepID=A0A1B9HU88_9TREE|nr:uncharacterized protein I206_07221 [Kwoniella pini CBS 10737]OCF46834.1 hypothetical protein I206_07221 [Kwoniella pini CBS 10737]